MKDEFARKIITKFVELRPKLILKIKRQKAQRRKP